MNQKWYADIESFGVSCLWTLEKGFKDEVEPLYNQVKNELYPNKSNKDVSRYENREIIGEMHNQLLIRGNNDFAKLECLMSVKGKFEEYDNPKNPNG
ncbi:hypothetical protein ACFL52_02675 [Candidatus Margulisiibacteriota bacterium]